MGSPPQINYAVYFARTRFLGFITVSTKNGKTFFENMAAAPIRLDLNYEPERVTPENTCCIEYCDGESVDVFQCKNQHKLCFCCFVCLQINFNENNKIHIVCPLCREHLSHENDSASSIDILADAWQVINSRAGLARKNEKLETEKQFLIAEVAANKQKYFADLKQMADQLKKHDEKRQQLKRRLEFTEEITHKIFSGELQIKIKKTKKASGNDSEEF